MSGVLKTFRIDKKNLKYLQEIKETHNISSVNRVINLIIEVFKNDADFAFKKLQSKGVLVFHKKVLSGEIKEKEIRIFVNEKELEILKSLAKQNGFSTTNKMAKLIVLNHLYDEPFLSQTDIIEFAKTNNLLRRIGINLNQFLRAIHKDSSAFFAKSAIENLITQIEKDTKEADKFIRHQIDVLRLKLK